MRMSKIAPIGKARQAFTTLVCVEIIGTQYENQDSDPQLQREVSAAIRIRDLACHDGHFLEITDLYQQLPSFSTQNQMARKDRQQRSLGTNQSRTNYTTNMQKEMEMDWTHAEKIVK